MIPYLLAIAGGYLLGDSMKSSTPQFADGGMMAKGGKPKVIHTQFEEEEFEYADGGEIKIYSEVEWSSKSPKTNKIETFKGKVIGIDDKSAEIKYNYDGKFFKTKRPLKDLKLAK